MVWARRAGVEVAVLRPAGGDGAGPAGQDGAHAETARRACADARTDPSHDPLGALAAAAGYDDPERWWEDLVESRLDGSSPFPLLIEAMAELRGRPAAAGRDRAAPRGVHAADHPRRAEAGPQRVAVVCGAWHAPALTWPLPPGEPGRGDPARLARRKVTLTWVPWTHERLASASGYGAGVTSPGWYHHLWTAPDQTIARWLTKVARALRHGICRSPAPTSSRRSGWPRRWPACGAAAGRPDRGDRGDPGGALRRRRAGGRLRHRASGGRPGPGLGQRAGADRAAGGRSDPDLPDACGSGGSRSSAAWDLDLRRPIDRARSQLFHRLRLLELDWIPPAESDIQSQGTFRETWASRWRRSAGSPPRAGAGRPAVAEAVVDQLEAVEVEQQDGEARRGCAAARRGLRPGGRGRARSSADRSARRAPCGRWCRSASRTGGRRPRPRRAPPGPASAPSGSRRRGASGGARSRSAGWRRRDERRGRGAGAAGPRDGRGGTSRRGGLPPPTRRAPASRASAVRSRCGGCAGPSPEAIVRAAAASGSAPRSRAAPAGSAPARGVADRALQERRVEPLLDQVVGRAGASPRGRRRGPPGRSA